MQHTWQLEASLANLGVIAMGHSEDSIMDACKTRHLVHFLWCRVDVSIMHIVEDGVVEQNCILTTMQKQNNIRLVRAFLLQQKERAGVTKTRVGGRKRHNAKHKNTVLLPSVRISLRANASVNWIVLMSTAVTLFYCYTVILLLRMSSTYTYLYWKCHVNTCFWFWSTS